MAADKTARRVNCLDCRLSSAQRLGIRGRRDSKSINNERENGRLHRGGITTVRARKSRKGVSIRMGGKLYICIEENKGIDVATRCNREQLLNAMSNVCGDHY